MSILPLIVVLDIPPVFLVDALTRSGLDIIAHDLHNRGFFLTNKVSEESSNHRFHAAAEYNNGYIVCAALSHKLLEIFMR